MPVPSAIAVAHDIAPLLRGTSWGIGGSALLYELGLGIQPNDLDIVVTEVDFAEVVSRLRCKIGEFHRPANHRYVSMHFARFRAPSGVELDAMAGIMVARPSGPVRWRFDPSSVEIRAGLPWMRASQWLELYELFDRPERVRLLRAHLKCGAEGVPCR